MVWIAAEVISIVVGWQTGAGSVNTIIGVIGDDIAIVEVIEQPLASCIVIV